MLISISIFWLIRSAKIILFWVYLWQLKDYHIPRFLAHFQTEKGRQILLSKLRFLKIILLLCFLSSNIILFFHDAFASTVFLPLILLVLYSLESIRTIKGFIQRKLKMPVFTKKTMPILGLIFILFTLCPLFLWQKIQQTAFIYNYPPLLKFCFSLLLIDILSPIILSLLILSFQPLTVLLRNQILKKAKLKRKKLKDLLVIGITGSYGKTSTKEFLYTILAEKFGKNKIVKTSKHQNSEIGISQCILRDIKPEHKIFICEMGAYMKGGIKLLCNIAKPKIGILTGINQQHLATFGSQEKIVKTKFELIKSLPENGIAILNGNNKHIISELATINKTIKTGIKKLYSIKEKKDIWAEDINVQKEKVLFKVFSKDGDSANFIINLLGSRSIENILAATVCAKELGMSLNEISKACEKIEPIHGLGKLIKEQNGLNIIDATYSANPDSVISHLNYLKVWNHETIRGVECKKIIIMPCLIELGNTAKHIHQKIGGKIGEICDLAIITTKEYFDEIKNSAVESGMDKKNILFIENPETILKKIKTFCRVGDIILLESRAPKKVIKNLTKTK